MNGRDATIEECLRKLIQRVTDLEQQVEQLQDLQLSRLSWTRPWLDSEDMWTGSYFDDVAPGDITDE